jgi:hypothetical protein
LYYITFVLFEIVDILCYKYIGVGTMPASYLMNERMQLTFRAGNDNLDLGWTTNGNFIVQSPIVGEGEPCDIGLGDVCQLNFKPIGLIVSLLGINIYNCGPICKDLPNNCFVVSSTYETRMFNQLCI